MTLVDFYELKEIRDLSFSPDGQRLAYVVTVKDKEKNSRNADMWMISVNEGKPTRLTYHEKADTQPRWSPDGRYLAFLSNRSGKKQIWLFNSQGGEPYQLTQFDSDIDDFIWSHNSSMIAFLAKDPKIKEKGKEKKGEEEEKKQTRIKKLLLLIGFSIKGMERAILMIVGPTSG